MKSSRPESAHWRSSKTRTTGSRAARRSKNSLQPANRSARSGAARSSSPEQVRQAGLDEPPLALVGHVLLDRLAQLLPGPVGSSSSTIPAGTDHLGQRPVRDALAVGEAAALVPQDVALQPVDVLGTPTGAGLPRPRLADHRDECGRPSRAASSSGVHDLPSSRSRPTNGASSPTRAPAPPTLGDHAQGGHVLIGCSRPLTVVRPGVLVGDRRLARAAGHVVDQHGPGRRDLCRREAVLTVSPRTIPSPSAPSSTAA